MKGKRGQKKGKRKRDGEVNEERAGKHFPKRKFATINH